MGKNWRSKHQPTKTPHFKIKYSQQQSHLSSFLPSEPPSTILTKFLSSSSNSERLKLKRLAVQNMNKTTNQEHEEWSSIVGKMLFPSHTVEKT